MNRNRCPNSTGIRNCAYVYVECSEIPLYTGQALYPEVAAFLAATGFQPSKRVNEQWNDGRLVQADHLFTRSYNNLTDI